MDFNIIKRIKLKDAFSGNDKFEDVISDEDYLRELFEFSNRGTAYVFDDSEIGHSTFTLDTRGIGRDRVLVIKNRHHKDIFLWHIDGVLYAKNTKCDCAILTDKELIFAEFKANAENQTDEAIIHNFIKAKEQLLSTITDIKNKCSAAGVELEDMLHLEAYAIFNQTVPDGSAYRKNISAEFWLQSDGIDLKFENEKKLIN